MLPSDAFIVNEARWFALDTVYLLIIRSGLIAGARVGGQLVATRRNYPSDATVYADPSRLMRWAAADPAASDFLRTDRKNFSYAAGELLDARLSPVRAFWTQPIPNSGSLVLVPRAGRKRRLILLGDQDPTAVHHLLSANGVPVSPLAA